MREDGGRMEGGSREDEGGWKEEGFRNGREEMRKDKNILNKYNVHVNSYLPVKYRVDWVAPFTLNSRSFTPALGSCIA